MAAAGVGYRMNLDLQRIAIPAGGRGAGSSRAKVERIVVGDARRLHPPSGRCCTWRTCDADCGRGHRRGSLTAAAAKRGRRRLY